MSLGYAHHGTPVLAVSDPRGLAIRAIQYHRRLAGDPVEARVTHQRFDAAGRPMASRDPYLFALAQNNASVPANLSQVFSLSAVPLSSESVDAGWQVALYGAAGQRVEAWDGRGSHSESEFDELLRPVVVIERGVDVAEQVLERFSYAGIDADAASRNLCGQLIRHDDPAGTLHLNELGLAGALLQQTRHFLLGTDPVNWPDSVPARDALLEPGEGATTSHTYAPGTELLQQIDALGNLQSLAYTVAGELKDTRLTLTGDVQPERTLVSDLRYNAFGQIEAQTAGNGVITRHHYDPVDGRLIVLSAHKTNGTLLQDLKYSYDAAGNVLSLKDEAQPIRYFNNQRIEPIKTYRYDTLYQLIEASGWEAKNGHGGPTLPNLHPLPLDPNQIAQYTQTYHCDAGGNLLELVHAGPQPQGRTLTRVQYSNRCLPERNGRPPTEAELAAGFDANGNLRELQAGQVMEWDLRNQLSTVRPVIRADGNDDYERYLYDGGGQRVRKLGATQTNVRTLVREVRYLPGVEIRSHGGTGEILHVITASAGSNSVQVLHWVAGQPADIANNQVRYSLSDHLKSSALELDQNADLISQEWYYPFGGTACFAARSATQAKYKTVHYSGKERDATGLYYYGLRYYAPWLQRWINPDPAAEIDGLNLYRFVRNNPIIWGDPNGTNTLTQEEMNTYGEAAYNRMFSLGSRLKGLRAEGESGIEAISRISNQNIDNLLAELDIYDISQSKVASTIANLSPFDYKVVHFSKSDFRNLDGSIDFLSRKKLQETGRLAPNTTEHTAPEDLMYFATDDFTFFSLETGASLKSNSTFGSFRYDASFESLKGHSHVEFSDLLNPNLRQISHQRLSTLPWLKERPNFFKRLLLSENEQTVLTHYNFVHRTDLPELTPKDLLFFGSDMLNGIGLRVAADLPQFSSATRKALKKYITSQPIENIGQVINALGRPQVLTPRMTKFTASQFKLTQTGASSRQN
ncbi:RHS repeat-associated core domain-containing protein [Pseudomonas laurylsulfativorans]|uniref:RHS repeat-associated core domain-containing protein n=1 Tax=Pseudomonas laurylsulfativorans TaxID=1943631 RepID=UPI001F0C14DF|nr:RHS repeat-associated core domain-containing protein [Pseudomonas laurylsulfativorans]